MTAFTAALLVTIAVLLIVAYALLVAVAPRVVLTVTGVAMAVLLTAYIGIRLADLLQSLAGDGERDE